MLLNEPALGDGVPVVACDARRQKSSRNALITLTEHAILLNV